MRGWVVGVCGLAAIWAGPSQAAEGVVGWPTYFRTGPGEQYRVVEELQRGTSVNVQECGDGWCRAQLGRALGYVKRAALGAGGVPPSQGAAAAGCFESGRAGYLGLQPFRYCPR